MDFITVTIKGALAYTLRDLMIKSGQPVDWERVYEMVNEMWPRMCMWMGISPNFETNISQAAYDKEKLGKLLQSDKVVDCPWVLDADGVHYRNKNWPEPEENEVAVEFTPWFIQWLQDHGYKEGNE